MVYNLLYNHVIENVSFKTIRKNFMRNKFRLSSVSLSLSLIIDISLKLAIDIYLFSYKKLSFFFFFFEKRNVHVSNRESSILEEFLKRRNGWFEPYSTINNETKRVGFYRLRGKMGEFFESGSNTPQFSLYRGYRPTGKVFVERCKSRSVISSRRALPHTSLE